MDCLGVFLLYMFIDNKMRVISLFKKIINKNINKDKIEFPLIEQEEINPIYNLESKKTQDKIYDYYDFIDNAIERNKETLK